MRLVFVDANVFKHSVGRPTETTASSERDDSSAELRSETSLLPQVAALSEAGKVRFTTHVEVRLELMGMSGFDGRRGPFAGPIVESLLGISSGERLALSPGRDFYELRDEHLAQVADSRYRELAAIVTSGGAKGRKRSNQLADALLLWYAERGGCTHFLTLDFALIKQIRLAKKLRLGAMPVRPSELLAACAQQE